MMVDYSYPTNKLFIDVDVDNICISVAKTTCKLVYKGSYNTGTPALIDMFKAYVRARELRSTDNLLVEVLRCHTEFVRKTLQSVDPITETPYHKEYMLLHRRTSSN